LRFIAAPSRWMPAPGAPLPYPWIPAFAGMHAPGSDQGTEGGMMALSQGEKGV